MSSTPFAESTAEALSARLSAARRDLARRWLDELNALLVVEKWEIFPGEQLLDHIPLIAEIAVSCARPEPGDCREHRGDSEGAELGSCGSRSGHRPSIAAQYHCSALLEFISTKCTDGTGRLRRALKVRVAHRRPSRILQHRPSTVRQQILSHVDDRPRSYGGSPDQPRIRQPLGVLQMVAHLMPRGGGADSLIDKAVAMCAASEVAANSSGWRS